jgi:hypothetical protein
MGLSDHFQFGYYILTFVKIIFYIIPSNHFQDNYLKNYYHNFHFLSINQQHIFLLKLY